MPMRKVVGKVGGAISPSRKAGWGSPMASANLRMAPFSTSKTSSGDSFPIKERSMATGPGLLFNDTATAGQLRLDLQEKLIGMIDGTVNPVVSAAGLPSAQRDHLAEGCLDPVAHAGMAHVSGDEDDHGFRGGAPRLTASRSQVRLGSPHRIRSGNRMSNRRRISLPGSSRCSLP